MTTSCPRPTLSAKPCGLSLPSRHVCVQTSEAIDRRANGLDIRIRVMPTKPCVSAAHPTMGGSCRARTMCVVNCGRRRGQKTGSFMLSCHLPSFHLHWHWIPSPQTRPAPGTPSSVRAARARPSTTAVRELGLHRDAPLFPGEDRPLRGTVSVWLIGVAVSVQFLGYGLRFLSSPLLLLLFLQPLYPGIAQ